MQLVSLTASSTTTPAQAAWPHRFRRIPSHAPQPTAPGTCGLYPLGEDILLLRSMKGKERLSTLFKYKLELISKKIDIKQEDLLGQPMTVRLDLPDDRTRYFNGIVSRFSHRGSEGKLTRYRATLVPSLWLLTRTTDCRIFQDRTAPDIIKEILREHGYIHFEECLTEPYRHWDYCVQYRETDFDFISRLMEQEDLYYFFRHDAEKHTLILADGRIAHDPIAGYEEIPYYPPDQTAVRQEHIFDWSVAGAVRPGAYTQTDFDYKKPRVDLLTAQRHPHAREDLRIYEYPGGYRNFDEGDQYLRVRIEELHTGYKTARGKGNARG